MLARNGIFTKPSISHARMKYAQGVARVLSKARHYVYIIPYITPTFQALSATNINFIFLSTINHSPLSIN